MPRLWARDAYVYGTYIASSYLLDRTQRAPVSVGTVRLTPAHVTLDTGSVLGLGRLVRFREHLRPLIHLASEGRLRDLHGLYVNDTSLVYILERILCGNIQPHLRSIDIWLDGAPLVEGKLRVMAPHPNLHHIVFWNMFTPFSLPNLVSLQLLCSKRAEEIRAMPQAWLDSLLDSLESCSALIDLRVMRYILPPPLTQRRITVPRLESLSCTDSGIFQILHLPALQRVNAPIEAQVPANDITLSLRASLSAIFERYGFSPRSLNISQREGRTPRHFSALCVRLGGEPLGYPPSPSLPLEWGSFTLEEPGPFVSFAFKIHRETGTRALSLLFSEYARVVRSILGADTIETLAFDNETREHTFDREDGFISPAATQEPVWGLSLPSFPAVRKIVLPFRDNDTIYHIISSLVTDENCLHLPQLSCLSFNGPLHMAHTFMEIYPALASLLRVRAAPVMGVLPMTSLEFELFVDGALALLEDADEWIEPLRRTLAKAVRSGLGDRASITIQQEYAVADSRSGFPYFRLLATITYDT